MDVYCRICIISSAALCSRQEHGIHHSRKCRIYHQPVCGFGPIVLFFDLARKSHIGYPSLRWCWLGRGHSSFQREAGSRSAWETCLNSVARCSGHFMSLSWENMLRSLRPCHFRWDNYWLCGMLNLVIGNFHGKIHAIEPVACWARLHIRHSSHSGCVTRFRSGHRDIHHLPMPP